MEEREKIRCLLSMVGTDCILTGALFYSSFVSGEAYVWAISVILVAAAVGGQYLFVRFYRKKEEAWEKEQATLISLLEEVRGQNTELTGELKEQKEKGGAVERERKELVSDLLDLLKAPMLLGNDKDEQLEERLFQLELRTKRYVLESGIASLHKENASLNDTVAVAVERIRERAEEKAIAIIVSGEAGLFLLHDSAWIQEAIYYIVWSGIMESGAGNQIAITLLPYEMFIRIDILETGVFVKKKEREEEFKGNQALFLASKIITMQDGYVKVASKEWDKGSRFSIFLPKKK